MNDLKKVMLPKNHYTFKELGEWREEFQLAFSEAFNWIAEGYDMEEDCKTNTPWCCPWFWLQGELDGSTVEELAEDFWEYYCEPLRDFLKKKDC